MSACQRSLDHQKIRDAFVLAVPHLADDQCGFCGGNDRRDFRLCPFHKLRQRNRKSGAGNNDVCTCLYRFFHILGIIAGCHHNIKSNDTFRRDLPCFFQFFANGTQICFHRCFQKLRILKTDLGSGDNADPSGFCHCACQGMQADTNSHTALDDRIFCCKITDF